MIELENNSILDKLSIHINSFNEGFKYLASSKSLNEIGEKFVHILRGNLLLVDINLFYKENANSEWTSIFAHSKNCLAYIHLLQSPDDYSMTFEEKEEYKVFASLRCMDGAFWGLIIGNKFDRTEFNSLDSITLQIFIRLLDTSYQSYTSRIKEKELIFSLNHKVLQLTTLIDTGIEITKLKNNTQLLELALESAVAITNASKGIMRIMKKGKQIGSITIPGNLNTIETLESENKIETQVEFKGLSYIVTLIDKESRKGRADFNETDQILLTAFARQVHSAVENKELHKEALENENIRKELSVASSIQKKIIPEVLPDIDGYDLAGINIPSKEVGGDYYDCRKLNNGKIALIVADVAGKGISAALLVSTLSASLHPYLEMDIPLDELAEKMNKLIYNSSPPDKYITCIIALLSPSTGGLEIINAGHNPALLLRKNNTIEKLLSGGIPFGMLDMGLKYTSEKLIIEKGERILMYTDGIPEAMNENEIEYSENRVENYCLDKYSQKAKEFIAEFVLDVKSFTDGSQQSDDITALYLVRN
jgi:phosphoserine phosphatase RsbU/P